MVNISELSINSVTKKKPNVLTGFDQNGEWLAGLVPIQVTGTLKPSEKRQDLTHPLLLMRNTVIPTLRLKRQADRKGGRWRAGIGWRKKRMPPCNRADRGWATKRHHPDW